MKPPASVAGLVDRVVQGGYCVGCGACAAVEHSPLRVELDAFGRYQARLAAAPDDPEADPEADRVLPAVCPFSGAGPDEDELARELFGPAGRHDARIGRHLETWAGHVREKDFRAQGSSGGVVSWLLAELLQRGMVDGVLHVRPRAGTAAADDERLFRYAVSRTGEEARAGSKSRYYPVEMSEVLTHVREHPGRYAVVGVPCFVKAVRLLARQDPLVRERVRFAVGIVCGHAKSERFAGLFAWQSGIHPAEIESIDFRHALPGRPANQYGIRVAGRRDGEPVEVVRPNREHFGYLWGQGFFKLEACDYCDDVFGETADVSVGDAWLPPYLQDSRGTSVVVVRHPELAELLREGRARRALHLEPLTADAVARSQRAGLRHRREGLAYRLWRKDRRGLWRPRRRVAARRGQVSARRRRTYWLRMRLAERSHRHFAAALDAGDFAVFRRRMQPWVTSYEILSHAHPWRELCSRAGRGLRRLVRAGRP